MKPERLNIEPDHLSRIESGEELSNIDDELPDAKLFRVEMVDDHYKQIVQFLGIEKSPKDFTTSQKKQLVVGSVEFQMIIGKLYKMGPDKNFHRYVLLHEKERVLAEVHDGIAG